MITNLEQKIKDKIFPLLPDHPFREVILYSMFPAGKLFRPNLCLALAKDKGHLNEDHINIAAAIEAHHVYSLIHDDLPAMDNDDYRRGRLSSHKKFNEALAILAGDSLLNISYQLLAQCSQAEQLILRFAQYCGPTGLILGQVLDLTDSEKNFKEVLRIHELKTSRLIQAALVLTSMASDNNIAINKSLDEIDAFGKNLGIAFQLIDDYLDLNSSLSEHEKQINPFCNDKNEFVVNYTKEKINDCKSFITQFPELEAIVINYFNKSEQQIINNKNLIKETVGYWSNLFE